MTCATLTLFVGVSLRISAATTVPKLSCSNASFPINLDGFQINYLSPVYNMTDVDKCREACCKMGSDCVLFQWSEHPAELPRCWVGPHNPIVGPGPYTTRERKPPAPVPQPPAAAALTIDIGDTGEIVHPELYGHDLEFTRHDLFSGLSAEIIANRKFAMPTPCLVPNSTNHSYTCWPPAIQQLVSSGLAPRWKKIGSATLAPPWYGETISSMLTGDRGHSIECRVQHSKNTCGVSQSGYMEGFDSENAFGSSIVLQHGYLYSLRLVMKGSSTTHVYVKLVDDGGRTIHAVDLHSEITSHWSTLVSNFTVKNGTTTNATLSIWSVGEADWGLGTVSLTEVHNTWRGMRKDVIAALKETGFKGLFRYPGGCYAPFYRWKIGLLDADRRPPIETPPDYCAAVAGGVNAYTDGFMENGIGIDDFLALCDEVGFRPALTIRFQFGQQIEVQEAFEWVEYLNGDASTTWGALRAERGHPEPYKISYWYLGNEIGRQLRYPNYPNELTQTHAPNTTEYAYMLKKIVPPMLAKSPSLPLKFLVVSNGAGWDMVWASEVGDNVYAASNHDGYYAQPVENAWTWSEAGVTNCAKRPQREFIGVLQNLRQDLDSTNYSIAISADEWGLGPPWATANFSVTHAMYAAGFLGAVTRVAPSVNLRFTNYFEPINEGAIQVHPFHVQLTPVGQVMKIYSEHQGGLRIVLPPSAYEGGDLDIVSTLHKDGDAATGNHVSSRFTVVLTIANLNAIGWFDYHTRVTLKGCGAGALAAITTLKAHGFSPSSLFDTLNSTATIAKGEVLSLVCPPFSVVHARIAC